ncbi:hypothetical protein YN1HA_8630 [Sulfurisphaera ohwakuensis]
MRSTKSKVYEIFRIRILKRRNKLLDLIHALNGRPNHP